MYGGFGHSLFLAMGFPFETSAAVARLILSGVLDKYPDLKLLLAHRWNKAAPIFFVSYIFFKNLFSGGTLPFLSGRLDSCVEGEPGTSGIYLIFFYVLHSHWYIFEGLQNKLKLKPSEYLKKLYYDAVIYHTPAMKMVHELVGCDTMMFGTDHPFFPPSQGTCFLHLNIYLTSSLYPII